MSKLKSTLSKIIVLLCITIVLFAGWQVGGENFYARALVGTTNLILGINTEDTHIEYVEEVNDVFHFEVFTRVDGRKASYPQETGGLMQPFVIILSWQIFLFFVLTGKRAFRALLTNFVVFFLIQVIFMILLTGYYNSEFQQYLFTMMMDSFYIIALVLVIKDQMLYQVFTKKATPKTPK